MQYIYHNRVITVHDINCLMYFVFSNKTQVSKYNKYGFNLQSGM